MTRIPAMRSLGMRRERFVMKLKIEVLTHIEVRGRPHRCAQQTVIMGCLVICRRAVWLRQLHPLNAAGRADLHPARFACGAKCRPGGQRHLQEQDSDQAPGNQASEGAVQRHGRDFIIRQLRPPRTQPRQKAGAIRKNCCLKKQRIPR